MFFLDRGVLPPDLGTLARRGYLRPSDLTDAWSRPFALILSANGYRLIGLDGNGAPVPGLSMTHRFTPVERMMIVPEGAERAAVPTPGSGS